MCTTDSSFLKKTLKNEQGIALLLVMGVISILTFLLADFTFETKLNKIKIYNQQDKIQARLNAESGLNFALAKLRLYQEGRNRIEKDENLKNAFPSSDLEAIITQPFIFPPPVSGKANIIQRSAVDEFLKKTIFNGEVSITFNKISGFLNPNQLRLKPQGQDQTGGAPGQIIPQDQDAALGKTDGEATADQSKKAPAVPASVVIEKKLVETLQRLIKDKNDNDEEFHQHYANVDANYLVQELKYYVNDRGSYTGSERAEIEAKFSQKNITPKFAPLSSIDELYLLPSWDDALVDLVKDRMSVHEVSVIAVNEITVEDLKILFPSVNNIQIEEFFKYRDGDIDKKIKGKKFKNADDFKRVMTTELNIVTDSEYQERINALKNAGLVIDTSGKLYKVTSRGTMNNAVYNLVAYVDLPIKPQPKKPPTPAGSTPPPLPGDEPDPTGAGKAAPPPGQNDKEKPTELLKPRVVEIRLE
ncbi:MAG: hypothetical protein ACXVCE_09425 [Bacteriovorax sp.]